MSKKINLVGKIFNRLTVLEEYAKKKAGGVVWRCKCICGEIVFSDGYNLKTGHIKSCGCWQREVTSKRSIIHGESSKNTAEYRTWKNMMRRCYTPSYTNFQNWGGRGIIVCEHWHTYKNFLNDMGRKPTSKHSIDRIDNNGNYEPNNCRWATYHEQMLNKSTSKHLRIR